MRSLVSRATLPLIAGGFATPALADGHGATDGALAGYLNSALSFIQNNAVLVGGGILAVIAMLALRSVMSKRGGNAQDTLAIHSLVAMSQVAIADGRIDDAEVLQISQILTRLTGKVYGPENVMEMLQRLNPSAADLAQVGQDLTEKDRQLILEAALNIAVADSDIHPNEYAVISELAQRMKIGSDQFRSAMARISAHLQTTPAA